MQRARRGDEAQAVGQTWRRPGSRCRGRGPVEDGEEADHPPAAQSAGRQAVTMARPSTSADSAMPISAPGSGHPHQPERAAEGHHQREGQRSSQMAARRAGRPTGPPPPWPAHGPGRTPDAAGRRATVGAAGFGVRPAQHRPAASANAAVDADESIPGLRRHEVRRAHRIAPTSTNVRWMVQNAPGCRPHNRAGVAAAAATQLEHAKGALQQHHQQHEGELPEFDRRCLKSSSASGISSFGKPISVSPAAKPKPCSRPKAKATTQGWRIVKLVSPRQARTISGPRKQNAQRDGGVERQQRRRGVATSVASASVML